MCMAVLWLASVSLLICPSLSCLVCFIKPQVSAQLCDGYIVEETSINSVDDCFRLLDSLFDMNEAVMEAGRAAGGLDGKLKEILEAEILPIAKDFLAKRIMDTVYKIRLQKAADNFIAAASKLPRDTLCIPPCGFQNIDAAYNCETCQYDSCLFPLDCPVEEIEVMEGRGIEMRCEVPFNLPNDIEAVWRFAEFKTQETEQFKEVTAGPDTVYFISSTSPLHTGTYQCEMFSGIRSIVRLYFYVTVIPQPVVGHTALQGIFDLSLLPRGQLLTEPTAAPHSSTSLHLLFLLTACLASSLLLLFVSLGFLYWLSVSEVDHPVADSDEEDYFGVSMLAI